MIRVFIADDDVVIRTQLKTIIDWESHGYHICGEASNGKSALEMIGGTAPHIIITDMNMPILDGVGLIAFINKNYPKIKIIALSAYDDYDYVRQSLRMGAVDYILKHKMDAETLLSTLGSAVREIEKEKSAEALQENIVKQLSFQRGLLQKELLLDILKKEGEDKALAKEFYDAFQVKKAQNIVCIILEIDDYMVFSQSFSEGENKFINSYKSILEEIIGNYRIKISHIEEGKYFILLEFKNLKSEADINYELSSITERIKSSTKRYFDKTVSLGVSKICISPSEIIKCIKEAQYALEHKFSKGKNKVFKAEHTTDRQNLFLDLDSKDEKDIYISLKSASYDSSKTIIDNIFNKLIMNDVDMKTAKYICFEIINIILKVLKENGIKTDAIYGKKENPFDKIEKIETAEDEKTYILNLCQRTINILNDFKINEAHSEHTKKAIKFINENYKKRISLNDAANYIGISSAYLSHVFKSEYKGGFTEYLNLVRVENAKLMIRDDNYNLKEIVSEVGFSSYNYFFKVFKDITGITPAEYKLKIL